ncbi:unnamed protein product [Discosporangium mesarthrocarpum]
MVEIGVPGWQEAKAAMTPPPPYLVEAAGDRGRGDGATAGGESRQVMSL